MPKTKRQKPLYQRGGFKLVARQGRANLEIIWNDPTIGRERSISAGTASVEDASRVLDDKFLEVTQGRECCPTCHRPYETDKRLMALEAIEVYLASAKSKPSYKSIEHRLNHVVQYIETLHNPGVLCHQVDEAWIAKFRAWLEKIPVVSPAGNVRQRALSTVENSVLQLAAAFRHAKEDPQFKTIQLKTLNRTPSYRATVEDLGRMLRYALTPKKRRGNLLAFLRVAIATMARPDAVHDASMDPKRGQWYPQHEVFDLNPRGRRQTKKYRATVPIAKQAAWLFEGNNGALVSGNAKKSMAAMAKELGLPGDGEAGLKLIRRSMAHLVRQRLEAKEKPLDQLEVFLGHRVVGAISELYAPFSATYLGLVKQVVEDIIDELEKNAPGAFYRDFTAQGGNVVSIARA